MTPPERPEIEQPIRWPRGRCEYEVWSGFGRTACGKRGRWLSCGRIRCGEHRND